MADAEPMVQCEECGEMVPEPAPLTETYAGARGHTVTIAFCEECSA